MRHGESEADLLNVHEGQADFELTESGQIKAAAKRPEVKYLPVDKTVYGQKSHVVFRVRAEAFLKRFYAECHNI
ncbi:MAG: histidine phosphatase family protein [Clostridiales bacterium]|nr:histidine phosphatase family protein [Clostridiales bacterium]